MKNSTITILIVVAAVVVVIYMAQPKAPSSKPTGSNSNAQFFSGLGSLVSGIAGLTKGTPSPTTTAPPTYDPTWGYVESNDTKYVDNGLKPGTDADKDILVG